jgi:hypothetical protein
MFVRLSLQEFVTAKRFRRRVPRAALQLQEPSSCGIFRGLQAGRGATANIDRLRQFGFGPVVAGLVGGGGEGGPGGFRAGRRPPPQKMNLATSAPVNRGPRAAHPAYYLNITHLNLIYVPSRPSAVAPEPLRTSFTPGTA